MWPMREKDSFTVYVSVRGDPRVPFGMVGHKSTPISGLKASLAELEGVDPECVLLYYGGNILSDEESLVTSVLPQSCLIEMVVVK